MDLKEEAYKALADKMGITLSTSAQIHNFSKAVDEAKSQEIDPEVFLRLLAHENNFNNDGGNGGGVGQFIDSTAKGYGYTQDYLRSHPDEAVKLSARLLKDNASHLGGDMYKAAAAYFVGADIINDASKMPGDWLQNADTLFQQRYPGEFAKQGGPSSYVKNLGVGYVPSKFGSGSTPAVAKPTTSSVSGSSGLQPPNIADFQQDDGEGGKVTDTGGYYKAWNDYMQAQETKQKLDSGPLAAYVNDTINDITKQIESGRLDSSRANDLLTTKVNSFKNANDVYSSKTFTSGLPMGVDTIPGTSIKVPSGGLVPMNPLQQALDTNNQAQSLFSSMQPVKVPSVQEIMAGYQGQYGGSPGGAPQGQSNPLQAAMQNTQQQNGAAPTGPVQYTGFNNTPPPPPPTPPMSDPGTTNKATDATSSTSVSDIAALARILAQQAQGIGAPN